MTTGIILPEFDPFVISIGGFGIRWYALAYIIGLVGGYWILRREARAGGPVDVPGIESLLNHVLLGVILGGRLGFVLFYQPAYYLSHPLDILKICQVCGCAGPEYTGHRQSSADTKAGPS